MKKKYLTLKEGIKIMLEVSKDNPNIEFKANFMTNQIKKYMREHGYSEEKRNP